MSQEGAPARKIENDGLTTETLARERALRAAVLIDAVRCLLGVSGIRERRSRQTAMRWVLSHDTRSPFSFHNICESLGFEPTRVRRLLLGPGLGITAEPGPPLAVLQGPFVRRPRRDRARYVVFHGGKTS